MSKQEAIDFLRAREPLIIVNSADELATERALVEAAAAAGYITRVWDCAQGLCEPNGDKIDEQMIAPSGPDSILDGIKNRKDRCVYILRDFHAFWGEPFPLRTLRTLARNLQGSPKSEARTIIILTSNTNVPPELKGQAPVITWALPTREEMGKLLDDTIASLPEEFRDNAAPNGQRTVAVDAAMGLTRKQASDCFALSLIKGRTVDPALVSAAKKSIIATCVGLRWEEPNAAGLDAIGGLENIKSYLVQRKAGFSERARAYGLKSPKGIFLAGLPGCGKTEISKSVSRFYGIPLVVLDMGKLKGKFVGESEANLRTALQMLEAIAPCVVRIDEIEKSLAGASGEGGDGGVSADALGTFLSWMQDKKAAVFVVATANDVRSLPPELLRKGRFDEIFFVDLPTTVERGQILKTALVANGRGKLSIDLATVASVTAGFSGAEIAALVPDAMFVGFADGEREITTADIVAAAGRVVPLSKTAKTKIDNLRAWGKENARMASAPEVIAQASETGRALDM